MVSIQDKLKSMEILFDQEEYLVIDNGTGFIKAGFSGQDLPRIVLPTVVGSKKREVDENMLSPSGEDAEQYDYSFGNEAINNKASQVNVTPIERGIINDWESMERLWTHIFDQLSLEPKNVNVLMTDSPFASKGDRTQMAQIMFDKLQVKSLAVMNTAALSMYSSGRVSGLIAEVGEGISYTVPVFQGYALPHA